MSGRFAVVAMVVMPLISCTARAIGHDNVSGCGHAKVSTPHVT
jgi:hypothetical protein